MTEPAIPFIKPTFAAACTPHRDALLAFASRLTLSRDGAQDIVQETMLRALEHWEKFMPDPNDAERSTKSWLCRICMNTFINHYRRRRYSRRREREQHAEIVAHTYGREDVSGDVATAALFEGIGDEVSAAIATLDVDHQAVIERADLRGIKYGDIAKELHIPIGTVMSRLHRARRRLGELLGDYAATAYGIRRPTVLVIVEDESDRAVECEVDAEPVEGMQPDADRVDRVMRVLDHGDLVLA